MSKKESTKQEARSLIESTSLFHANEDGTSCQKTVDVYLNRETHEFEIDVPDYMVVGGAFEGGASSPLSDKAFIKVTASYEDLSDRYSKWRLAQGRTPMLWLGTFVGPGDYAREQFGVDSMAGMGIREVVVAKDGDNELLIDPKTLKVAGSAGVLKPILLKDTPEVRAKARVLIDSIEVVADILAGFRKTDDPTAYLLSIATDWKSETPISETPQPTAGSNADSTFEQAMSSASSINTEDDDVL